MTESRWYDRGWKWGPLFLSVLGVLLVLYLLFLLDTSEGTKVQKCDGAWFTPGYEVVSCELYDEDKEFFGNTAIDVSDTEFPHCNAQLRYIRCFDRAGRAVYPEHYVPWAVCPFIGDTPTCDERQPAPGAKAKVRR